MAEIAASIIVILAMFGFIVILTWLLNKIFEIVSTYSTWKYKVKSAKTAAQYIRDNAYWFTESDAGFSTYEVLLWFADSLENEQDRMTTSTRDKLRKVK